eukprot:TRINITY_DN11009_c0_g1_i1.p1 TRINITY_DN11009_c0_g1~~TRINITY_DN11009_c0_g1_i1.p1  ORF type:complete len:338 (+),score=31.36 TRINITY_DN11009_c0_g1_i1:125-1015(+)
MEYQRQTVPGSPYQNTEYQRQPAPGSPYQNMEYQRQPPTGRGGQLFDDIANGNDNFFSGAAGMVANPVVTSYVFNQGREWLDKNTSFLNRYLQSTNLKYYFCVDNSYVAQKIALLLCPLLQKSYQRKRENREGQEYYLPPKDDKNAPDLYIPVMAFVTYIILIAIVMGFKNKFTPEILGMTASTGFVSLIIQVLFLKFGFYLLDSEDVSLLDLISYSGYIFVSLVVNHLVGLIAGSYLYYIAMIVNGLFMAVFMVKTLRLLIRQNQKGFARSNYRNYFLLTVAALQLVWSYVLGAF